MNIQEWLTNNCDGSGPHSGTTTRAYPLGGGANSILCLSCAARENRYRHVRATETGRPENWPQVNWHNLPVYADVSHMKWNQQTCAKIANAIWRDGLGTPIHFRGYCSGITVPLPTIPNNYRFVSLPCWGYQLIHIGKTYEPKK